MTPEEKANLVGVAADGVASHVQLLTLCLIQDTRQANRVASIDRARAGLSLSLQALVAMADGDAQEFQILNGRAAVAAVDTPIRPKETPDDIHHPPA